MTATLEQALCELREQRARLAAQDSPALERQLQAVREWQSHRIAALHQARAERYNGQALLHFLTQKLYIEAQWAELTANPQAVARRIGKIISDDRPLIVSIRLQITADRLDTAMARRLVVRNGCVPLTARNYVRAFHAVDAREQRLQQIAWVEELVDLLSGYADNRAAYWAFKLARAPAQALGMAQTYALLAEGFAAMRATRNLYQATHEAAIHQRALLNRLLREPLPHCQ